MILDPAGFRRAHSGNAAIEFALIVPIMIIVIATVVEFGIIFHVYNQTNRLATHYAMAWSDCSDYPVKNCEIELSNYTTSSAIKNTVPQLDVPNLTLQMFQVKRAGATVATTYAFPAGSNPNASQAAAAQSLLPDGQVGVIVTVTYQHTLKFFPNVVTTYLSALLAPSYTVVQLKS